MYSYDRRRVATRVVTANMSLPDYYWRLWQKVLEQKGKLEAAASKQALKEAKHFLSELGLDLDLKKSSINTYRVGSDSWGHSVYMTLRDMWDRGPALTADFVAASVFDACRFQPRPGDVRANGPGQWLVSSEWGG